MRRVGVVILGVVSLLGAMPLVAVGGVAQADPPPVSFGPSVGYQTGRTPASVLAGDLDGDAVLDLVVVNYSSSTVSVLLGNGFGGFGDATEYTTGTDPYGLALGDLDGDENLDVVVTNYVADTVSIWLGDGAGGLGTRSDVPVGDGPYSVAIADLDGDTLPDLAVASFGSGVSVLFGDGIGGFGDATIYPTGAGASSVAIGDLDGDAAPDLVVANYGEDDASVLLNDGVGGFGPKQDVATAAGPYSVALGDLNGDTVLDLVATAYTADRVTVHLGDGAGGFSARTDYPTGAGPLFVTLGDLNGDTFLDVGVANYQGSSVSLLLGDGTGALGGRTDVAVGQPRSVTLDDLDGNGLGDLVITNYYATDTVSVLLAVGPACPLLGVPAHTTLSLSAGTRVGSVATFVADPGFELVGSSTLTCDATYTWGGVAPTARSTGEITVTPATGLAGGDEVDVQLSGFAPGAGLHWVQCLEADPAADAACAGNAANGVADAAGSLVTSFRMDRFIYVPDDARWADCADPLERCVIGAADVSDVSTTRVLGPTAFGPVPAPPPLRGTISLSPPGPVPAAGAVVGVTGSGFRPGALVDLHQCVADADHPSDCNPRSGSVVADGTGGFTTDVVVAPRVTPPGGTTTDCFSASGTCAIAAAEAVDFPGTVTSVAITIPPRVVPGPVAIRLEGDAGNRVMLIRVGLSAPSAEAVTVDWTTFVSTGLPWPVAQPGTDYVPASGTVTFAPGQIAQTVPVTINGDVAFEPSELVSVRFSNPTNATLGGGLLGPIGFGSIANDDVAPPPPPAVVPGRVSIRLEGDADTRVVLVKVGLSAATTQVVTVDWATSTLVWPVDSATPGDDYVAASGTAIFLPGQTSQTIPVTINGDTAAEPNELVVVRYSNPTNATLGGGLGALGFANIANDD